MKKTVKRIMSIMLALVLVVGTAQVPAREASAKGTKTYISSEGYQVEYCSDDFYGSRVGLGYSFLLNKQDLEKEIPVSVSFEKSKLSVTDAIEGAKVQSKQDVVIEKGTFGKDVLPSKYISYERNDDPRGVCKMMVFAVQGKKTTYIVTVTHGEKISQKISDDIEGILNSFKETQTPSVAKLYKDKIKQLKKKKKYKKGLSSVQLKIGKGAKVLVVTPTKNLYSDGATIKVDLYQAVKGKVKYICALKSNGTSYPVAYTKKAVLVASNHFAGKLEIDNGKATYSLISNFLVEKGKPVLTKYSVSNNKFKKISSKKISKKKAEKDFYYCDMKGNLRGEVIGFE